MEKEQTSKMLSVVGRCVGIMLAIGAFVWIGMELSRNWGQVCQSLLNVSPPFLLGAIAMHLAFTALMGTCWYFCLIMTGARVRWFPAQIAVLAAQLGKYMPGKVLYVASHIGLARWANATFTQGTLAFLTHNVQALGAGVLLTLPILHLVLPREYLIIVVVLTAAGLLTLASGLWIYPVNRVQTIRKRPHFRHVSSFPSVAATLNAFAAWVCYAGTAALITRAVAPDLSWLAYMQVGMAAVGAWQLGYISMIAPGGIGVREGAFVLIARSILNEPNAMIVAIVARLVYTSIQLMLGAIAMFYVMRTRQSAAPRSTHEKIEARTSE